MLNMIADAKGLADRLFELHMIDLTHQVPSLEIFLVFIWLDLGLTWARFRFDLGLVELTDGRLKRVGELGIQGERVFKLARLILAQKQVI